MAIITKALTATVAVLGFATASLATASLATPSSRSALAGTYTVSMAGAQGHFYVATSGKAIQDVAIPVTVTCQPFVRLPAGGPIIIAEIKLKTNGHFVRKETYVGLVEGQKATFSYEFSGTIDEIDGHAQTSQETARSEVDGTKSNGAHYHCDSKPKPLKWSATRDKLQDPTKPPSAGAYSWGHIGQHPAAGYGLSFTLATGAITKIAGKVIEECVSPQNKVRQLVVPLAPAGSISANDVGFTGKLMQNITFTAFPVVMETFTFKGHFHGTNSANKTRAAGMARAEGSYDFAGEQFHCDSNYLSWTATGR